MGLQASLNQNSAVSVSNSRVATETRPTQPKARSPFRGSRRRPPRSEPESEIERACSALYRRWRALAEGARRQSLQPPRQATATHARPGFVDARHQPSSFPLPSNTLTSSSHFKMVRYLASSPYVSHRSRISIVQHARSQADQHQLGNQRQITANPSSAW